MSKPDLPEIDVDVPTIDAETLKSRLDAGEDTVLLDTRPPAKHDEWRIESPAATHVNQPYYDYLGEDLTDDHVAELPEDEAFVVLCAKGHSSEFVAAKLQQAGYDAVALDEGMEGWARLYEYAELDADADADATVGQYYRPSSGCLAYLVVSGDEAAVFDPLRAFTDRYVEDAADYGASIEYVVDTHVHADHVSGLRELAAETGAKTVLSAAAADRGAAFDVDVLVEDSEVRSTSGNRMQSGDGDTLTVGDIDVEVLATPGHTSGMTSFRVGDVLLTGDGLFTDSVARPDLEEGDDGARDAARTLYETIQETILALPDDTRIAPAHTSGAADAHEDGTYTAPLGQLLEEMEALQYDREAFVDYVLADMPPRPANYEEIIETNLGRTDVDDDEAFTLELGPNNCAAGAAGGD
ncbi:MBL fold metallo-hydrolase [Halogeometricum limi]|uniref:Glyoxylase, beta-lactamase superfamily II n=1 Tax=Halogeometricum limi TaxID=555875 RepID=A0A1I6GKD7_9EURY|nr:MBL fold metallo-hydrolase [Halogeometricum limi]SFR42611.1 Glyoxylase, beta-lactamase superfamily II [Halogeometricum limi]